MGDTNAIEDADRILMAESTMTDLEVVNTFVGIQV